jgi:hypothetical protein
MTRGGILSEFVKVGQIIAQKGNTCGVNQTGIRSKVVSAFETGYALVFRGRERRHLAC